MTGAEQITVNELARLLQAKLSEDDEWRRHDLDWKQRVEGRIVSLETTRSVDEALVVERRRLGDRSFQRAIAIASVVAAVVVASVQIINFVLGQLAIR